MRHKQFIISAVLFFGLGLTGLRAQEALLASGGNVVVSGQGTVSYSVGQVVYTTSTETTGSVSLGVQQAYEISDVTGIEETSNGHILVTAYPNPATDYLLLKVDNSDISNTSYQLFNMSGKLVECRQLSNNEASIDFSNLDSGIYYLKVIENIKELRTFKIIKNQ
jgi:hypothetical protein